VGYSCEIFEGFDVGALTVQIDLLCTVHRVLLLQRVSCIPPFALNPSMILFLPSDAAYAPAQETTKCPGSSFRLGEFDFLASYPFMQSTR
jgi:hypothetical protein